MSSVSNRLRFYYIFLAVYLLFLVVFLKILRSYNQDTHTNAFKVLELYKKLAEKLNKESQLDTVGLYKFIEAKKSESEESFDLSVVSQCSSNHFSSVENLFTEWEGPVSVAVYSEIQNVEATLWDMARFLHCNNFRDFSMQLVVPSQDIYVKDYKFADDLMTSIDKSVSCSLPYISALNGRKNYNWTSPYPVNLLRNIAKSGTSTDYILIIDIDMLPSPNLRGDFLDFAKARHSSPTKFAYVVPAFETLPEAGVPEDKRGLLKMVEENQARPFYIVPCENCQKLTKYDEWLESEFSPESLAVFPVTNPAWKLRPVLQSLLWSPIITSYPLASLRGSQSGDNCKTMQAPVNWEEKVPLTFYPRLRSRKPSSTVSPFYSVLHGFLSAQEAVKGIRVLHQVSWKHPWEPFVITRRDAPNFDERFKQYGMNRVSQICELHVAGYKFAVLDNAFLIHKGYKRVDDFHVTKNREMESNRRVYGRFKIEIRYKYPESDRSC